MLQKLLRAHFEGFAAIYDRQYARRYGRFRLERISQAVGEFLRCGDYRFGVARLKCSNPSCGHETFRPYFLQDLLPLPLLLPEAYPAVR